MEPLKVIFIVGIYCLSFVSLLVSGEKDNVRSRPAIHEMRDAIHQVGYNYALRPIQKPSYWGLDKPSPSPQHNDDVTTLDRFYRVSPDGTIEFKIALSDGQINHQKIYNKIVNGRTIQVYDGYYSVRFSDGRYRTTYYRADERGYRLLGFNVDVKPPVEWRGHEHEMDKIA